MTLSLSLRRRPRRRPASSARRAPARPVAAAAPRSARRHWLWTARLDNHHPTRAWAQGAATEVTAGDGEPVVVLDDVRDLRDALDAVYLLDDGRRVRVLQVADADPRGRLLLEPFPTDDADPGADSHQLGPRRAYHLKLTPR